jgi:glucose 1-dehydrogenase
MDTATYKRLKNQVALVTGASTGIGRAIAIQMAREGAKVIVNYYSHQDKAKEVIDHILNLGGEAIPVQADVGNEQDVFEMFEKALSTFGTIHILVNNAGIESDSPIQEMSLEQWQKVINTNLTGTFLCTREAVKEFRKRGFQQEISSSSGKIICISSVHQTIPRANHSNYGASKGGMQLFMESVSQEVAQYGIRVNSIAPGAIKTDINRDSWETPEKEEDLKKMIPYGRVGDPVDIARAAVWLACDESDYVTGETLYVDGGLTLYPSYAPKK